MNWADVEHARLVAEVGARASRSTTPPTSARLIATHEAGHATVAWLVAPQRRLEVLTIVKRRGALGPAGPRRPRGRLHPVAARARAA